MDILKELKFRQSRLIRQHAKYSKLRKSIFLQKLPKSAESDIVSSYDNFIREIEDELLEVDLAIARYMFSLED